MVDLPPLPESLTDGTVALRPFAERDIPEVLLAYEADPELHLRLDEARPPSGAELGRRAEQVQALWETAREATLTVVLGGSEISRGEFRVRRIQPESRRCEVLLWLTPAVRGHGHGARVLRLGTRWLIDGCGFARAGWLPEAGGAAARAAAQRAGLTFEGVLRGYALGQGGRVDHAAYSRVAGDP